MFYVKGWITFAPPKIPTCFHQGAIFFSIFFPRLFVSKVRDTVVGKLCSFFSFAFISIVFSCDLLLNERREKTHTHKKQRLFFCVQSLRSPLLVYMQTICAPTQPMGMKRSWNNQFLICKWLEIKLEYQLKLRLSIILSHSKVRAYSFLDFS